jgi:hypothetical protein
VLLVAAPYIYFARIRSQYRMLQPSLVYLSGLRWNLEPGLKKIQYSIILFMLTIYGGQLNDGLLSICDEIT